MRLTSLLLLLASATFLRTQRAFSRPRRRPGMLRRRLAPIPTFAQLLNEIRENITKAIKQEIKAEVAGIKAEVARIKEEVAGIKEKVEGINTCLLYTSPSPRDS